MTGTFSEAAKEQYHRQGFLKLGRVLDDAGLARLQDRINDIMMGKADVDYGRLLMQLDGTGGKYEDLPDQTNGFKGPTLNYRKIQNLELDPVFLDYLRQPLFREICGYVYGSHASISCYRAMFMNKPAGKGTSLPWHQDGGSIWGLDRDPLMTVWTALDPSTSANGCVNVIPGSHRLGLLSDYGHTLSKEKVEEYCLPEKVLDLELAPGEAVLLHNWLIHSSGVNTTPVSRRAFSVCYMDARTRYVKEGTGFPAIFSGAHSPEGSL